MVLRRSCIFLQNNYPKVKFNTTFNKSRNFARQHVPIPILTPQEVTKILRSNEFTKEFESPSPIKYYDSNQLASNNPVEDTRSEARCKLTNGFLLGIFDGHGGNSCSQVISKRLFYYVSACLLSPETLKKVLETEVTSKQIKEKLLESFNDNFEFVSELGKLYCESFLTFVRGLSDKPLISSSAEVALQNAFISLDQDLSNEALKKLARREAARTLSVAMSGCVAVVAHVNGPHLHVASAGDCQAVLGIYNENEGWTAQVLNKIHNTDNAEEVERILSEHPPSEKKTVIKMDRLLGQLAPLRALGDFRYKWSREIMKKKVIPYFGESAIPPNYHTPPYLTAEPQVTYHRLTYNDKFLIIASDGLWDLMTPPEAVRLVGEHMKGRVALAPFKLPEKGTKLSEINKLLIERKEGLKKQPLDQNAATHLLRNALGGTEYGIDHHKLSQFLTLPNEVVRIFRDDITITVVYMDSDFLQNYPS
ncbi:pyruvate dehydrogenase [acetyl-transferring]-phosphatase 1, mitochondrial [Chelonus insularis]|uniref:pyruvate dehydrogenase [acetyl-transferring]-phosphatase 1, mitochondrial n=1 Tax=Chelonus insularis TaxID=460826 RepID=UPI001589432B|nr:pyruvate dehydrogenase [acetyl-transferring]-phosphatase 1, mitochondrial [Chelonus insularis]